jgi:hypothetical protein
MVELEEGSNSMAALDEDGPHHIVMLLGVPMQAFVSWFPHAMPSKCTKM